MIRLRAAMARRAKSEWLARLFNVFAKNLDILPCFQVKRAPNSALENHIL